MLSRIFSKRNKALISELVRTDFKLRYQGSILGYAWALLKPLFLFVIMYAVFGKVLRFGEGIPNYPVYLLLGIVLWGFFTDTTKQGMAAIVNRGELIRKIKFPKYIIVVSSSISTLINLGFNLLVIGVFILLSGADVQPAALLFFPLLLLELYIFSLAIAFYLAAVNVKYRDITHIWDILVQGGFYATPIFYPLQLVLERSEPIAKLLLTNPMAQIIQDSRHVLVTKLAITQPTLSGSLTLTLVPFGIVLASAVIGAYYFRKRSRYFAEDI